MLCWINGQYMEQSTSMLQFEFKFAEVFRTYEGVPVFFAQHFARLTETLHLNDIALPYTRLQLQNVIETLQESAILQDHYYCLAIAFQQHKTVVAIYRLESTMLMPACLRIGVNALQPASFILGSQLLSIPTTLCWARRGVLFISRAHLRSVMDIQLVQFAKILAIDVVENTFQTAEVERADELFLANSVDEFIPIHQYGQKRFLAENGPLYKKLRFAYRHRIARMIKGEFI